MSKPEFPSRRDFLWVAAIAAGSAGGAALAGEARQQVTASDAIEQLQRLAEGRKMRGGDVLAPRETALVIIDMINLFCDAKWLSGGDAAGQACLEGQFATIIPNLRRTLEAFRKADALVAHVVNAKWTREGREAVPYQRGRDYDLFDTHKMSVIDALKPLPGEIVIRKVASSAFTGTGLDFLLHNAGIKNVVLGGQYGSACVFYSLIQSREFGFSNYWLDDGILYGGESARVLFRPLVGAYWARLAATDDVVRAVGAKG